MQTADVVAVYGAALSTALALSHGVGAWRGRARLALAVEFFKTAGHVPYGTPVRVGRRDDVHDESVAVQLTIRNVGGVPVQVLGLVIETTDFNAGTRLTYQVTPAEFPVVLEPGTTVEGILQKEHFDMLEECTFMGIVDGMARRHCIPRKEAARFLTECWRLPTRVNVFQRRDDPRNQVAAFQAAEPARLTTRRVSGWRKKRASRAIATRPKPLIRTLLDGDQARVKSPDDHR